MSFTCVVTSDNHLDAYYEKMRPVQLEERRKRILSNFNETIEYALENDIDYYFNCGDLFDRATPRNPALIAVTKAIRRMSEKGIESFLIGGTHDTPKSSLEGAMPSRIFHESGHARLFPSVTRIETVSHKDVCIGGLSTDPRLKRGVDPLEGKSFGTRGKTNILLLHYGIEGYIHEKTTEAILSKESLYNFSGVDFFFVGHVHAPGEFELGKKHIVIPGATERMSFGEKDAACGFYSLEIEGSRLMKKEYVTLACQPMVEIEIRSPDIPDAKPTEYILDKILSVSKDDTMFKLSLVGDVKRDLYHKINFHEIFRRGTESNFYFDLDRRRLSIESDVRAVKSARLSQREELIRAASDLATEEGVDEDILLEAKTLVLSKYEGYR